MVHVGEPPPSLGEILRILGPGDVVTRCFNGTSGAVAGGRAVFELARRSAEAGVLMDVGHGAASFDFGVAARSIAGGLRPFSISTDLHAHNADWPVFDLATTVS